MVTASIVKSSESLLASLGLPSRASCSITVLRVYIQVSTWWWAEVRVSGLGPLSTDSTAYLRRLPIDLRPVEVLQILVSELAFILKVPRA